MLLSKNKSELSGNSITNAETNFCGIHSFFVLLADYALGRHLQAEGHASYQEQRRAHPVDETRRTDDTHSRAGQIPRQTKKVRNSQHSQLIITVAC